MTDSLISHNWFLHFKQYPTIWVGLSGGLDSTVLLHHFVNLTYPYSIRAIHINHGLHPDALIWQEHCEKWCQTLGIPLVVESISLAGRANLEAMARSERYRVFKQWMQAGDCVVLAHHQNDQAETLLLQLFRGTGINGLAAMPDLKPWGKGFIARPLLNASRDELKDYALRHQLSWIDDDSNDNNAFSRNFVRNEIIPALQTKWPAVLENMARTAGYCGQAKANLTALAKLDCPDLEEQNPVLSLEPLEGLNQERLENVIRVWLRQHQVRMPSGIHFQNFIATVLGARADATPLATWDDIEIRRYQNKLYLLKKGSISSLHERCWETFPQSLVIPELNGYLHAVPTDVGLFIPLNAKIVIRFRQGGERLQWRGQVKHLKKLFQAWQIPPWQRNRVPLLYIDDELAAVIGYAISDLFWKNSSRSFSINWITSNKPL